ncbi:MAG: SAM-dependent methyltransferase [Campylobacter sp.]|nr:SAM-dependent methyltransferase [Campylobacter sp.]
MKFSEYFEAWLNQNYYKNIAKIGKDGDFYTAVSVGGLFGAIIANKILRISDDYFKSNASNSTKIAIVEIGTNEGYLIGDIISGLYGLDESFEAKFEFFVLEPLESLQELQKGNFAKRFGNEVQITHLEELRKDEFDRAIFISNELFDTFSVELFDNGKMAYIKNHRIYFDKADLKICQIADKFSIIKGEIPINLDKFISQICESTKEFDFISFDYFALQNLDKFSIRVYKNHQVFNLDEISLSEFFGVSDITYNVNFDIIKDYFLNHKNIKLVDFKKQSVALVEFGADRVLEILRQKGGETHYQNGVKQLKRLIYEFDDKFKMTHFKKVKR